MRGWPRGFWPAIGRARPLSIPPRTADSAVVSPQLSEEQIQAIVAAELAKVLAARSLSAPSAPFQQVEEPRPAADPTFAAMLEAQELDARFAE